MIVGRKNELLIAINSSLIKLSLTAIIGMLCFTSCSSSERSLDYEEIKQATEIYHPDYNQGVLSLGIAVLSVFTYLCYKVWPSEN